MPKNLKNKYSENKCDEAPSDQREQRNCSKVAETFFYATRYINQYDVYRKCYYDLSVDLSLWPRKTAHLPCLYTGPLEAILNDEDFKRSFNVDVEDVPHWQKCSDSLKYTPDRKSLSPLYQKFRHKYKLMFYVGDTD